MATKKTSKIYIYPISSIFLSTILGVLFSYNCLIQASWAQPGRDGITIQNTKQLPMNERTAFDTGPCVGNILNVHFFPGLLDYLDGNYTYSLSQMDYFIARPNYTAMNPNQRKYLSIAHYIRGSILLDHATGIGRHEMAINDFTASIEWNRDNYHSYLKLAKSYLNTNLQAEAKNTLQSLLASTPPESIKNEANNMLRSIVMK